MPYDGHSLLFQIGVLPVNQQWSSPPKSKQWLFCLLGKPFQLILMYFYLYHPISRIFWKLTSTKTNVETNLFHFVKIVWTARPNTNPHPQPWNSGFFRHHQKSYKHVSDFICPNICDFNSTKLVVHGWIVRHFLLLLNFKIEIEVKQEQSITVLYKAYDVQLSIDLLFFNLILWKRSLQSWIGLEKNQNTHQSKYELNKKTRECCQTPKLVDKDTAWIKSLAYIFFGRAAPFQEQDLVSSIF